MTTTKASATPPMATKTCTSCKRTVPIVLMKNRGGGRPGAVCKACANAQNRARYWADPDRWRARSRAFARTARGRQLNAAAVVRWKARNPHKVQAATIARDAIRRGLIVRPATCQAIGCQRAAHHGHHQRYDRPLDLSFLCSNDHARVHLEGVIALKPGGRRKYSRAPLRA